MVGLKVKWDLSKFTPAWEAYKARHKKCIAKVTNNTLSFIARNAVNFTKKTPQAQIESEMGQIQYTEKTITRGKRAGQVTRKRQVALVTRKRENETITFAEEIIASRRAKAGLEAVYGKKRLAMATRMVFARIAARAFISSTWLKAIKDLAPYVKTTGGIALPSLVKMKGQPTSLAKPAQEGTWKASGFIESDILGGKTLHPNVQKVVVEGLQSAIDQETGSKLAYLLKKEVEENTRQFNNGSTS